MEHGDRKKIAEELGVGKSYVSNVLNGYKTASPKQTQRIYDAMDRLGISLDSENVIKKFIPPARKYRFDLYNNMPVGGVVKIAESVGCSKANVSAVLSGKSPDNFGIIKEAELLAAINIWKTRFCKFKSEL